MSRYHIRGVALKKEPTTGFLTLIQSPTVTVYNAGSGTGITQFLWTAPTAGSHKSNPFTGNADGSFEFWIDSQQYVKIVCVGALGETVTFDWEEPQSLGSTPFVNLFDYAGGVTIWDGVSDSDAAWTLAFAATPNGGNIFVGAGIVLYPSTAVMATVHANTTIIGLGDATVLLHRPLGTPGGNQLNFTGKDNCWLNNLTVDGNWANNHAAGTGFVNDFEVVFSGAVGCGMVRVKMVRWNCYGVLPAGTRVTIMDCNFEGLSQVSYVQGLQPDFVTITQYDWGSLTAIECPGTSQFIDLSVINTKITGTRAAGAVFGGTRTMVDGLTVLNCARADWPYTIPGAQVAWQLTWDGVTTKVILGVTYPWPTVMPTDCMMNGLEIGPTTVVRGGTNAMETGPVLGFSLSNFKIQISGTGAGINMDDGGYMASVDPLYGADFRPKRISISHGEIRYGSASDAVAVTATGFAGIRMNNGLMLTVSDVHLRNLTTGISLEGATDDVTLMGNKFRSTSTTNLTDTSGTTIRNYVGNECETGTAIGNILSAGLTVASGGGSFTRNTTGTFALTAINAHAGGQGALIQSTSGNVISLSTAVATGLRLMIGFVANNVPRGFIGLNSAHFLSIFKPDGSAETVVINPTTGDTVIGGVAQVNGSITGSDGLAVTKNATGTFAADVTQNHASGAGLRVAAAAAIVMSLSTAVASGSRQMLQLVSNGVSKAYIGLAAGDVVGIFKGDTSGPLFTVDPATGNTVISGTALITGAATLQNALNVGTTGASAGEAKTSSHVKAGGTVYPSGQVSTGYKVLPNTTVTTGGTNYLVVGINVYGMLFVADSAIGARACIALCEGGNGVSSTASVNGDATIFNIGSDAGAVAWSIFRDAGTGEFRIKNRSGADRIVAYQFIGG